MEKQFAKRVVFVFMWALMSAFHGAGAATSSQRAVAINAGLEWLANNQYADGRWHYSYDGYSDPYATSAALKAFLAGGYQPGNDVIINGANYGDVIGKGFNFLFSQTTRINISQQPAGNPDTNGNGYAVWFGNQNRATYNTGMAMMALAASADPMAVVTTGTEAGRTYADVMQDAIDYFAFGQYDSGYMRGGWRFYHHQGAGNENSPWAAMGMLDAENKFGAFVPQYVKDELNYWVNFIQYRNTGHPYDGSSGFTAPTDLNNESKTGGLLSELLLTGADVTDDRVQAALGYLNRQWPSSANNTFYGNFGDPYAMIQICKGLELTVGLEDTTFITNLVGSGDLDLGVAPSWYQDYCEYLVNNQLAGGNWTNYAFYDSVLATSWNIDILNTSPLPEPATLLSLFTGAVIFLKKRRCL